MELEALEAILEGDLQGECLPASAPLQAAMSSLFHTSGQTNAIPWQVCALWRRNIGDSNHKGHLMLAAADFDGTRPHGWATDAVIRRIVIRPSEDVAAPSGEVPCAWRSL